MSCHLTCPTCHNKFFKISNMSIPNSRGDIVKPVFTTHKLRKSNSSELETALRYNVKLEKENTTLRTEIHDLAVKNDNLLQALNMNKEKFEDDFNKLQDEIRFNEQQLVENSRKCLEQQTKSADEIKKLKQENEILKRQRNDVETFLAEKLKSLESEIKIMKLDNENLRYSNKENEEKCIRYKTKLKHAVKIVNDLNKIIADFGRKPEIICETTQTDWDNNGEKSIMFDMCGDPNKFKRDLNSENLLLSDIFFKPKSFMDSEISLFSAKSKSRCSSKTKIR